ncbi:MAG: HDOD domain-containing protein [Thiobacillus sp.]
MTKLEQLQFKEQLPSPKGVALAVLALSRREDVALGEIALVVQSDPALSGRLIKLANSASQITRPVVSVQEAVARQGVKAVCQLALGFSLLDQYRDGACDSFDYPRYWSHSLLMGLAMQALGARVRVGVPDELFICGLLAQVGQLALATVYPEEYNAVLTAYQANPEQDLAAFERAQLETDHIELGAAMMSEWGIPGVFTQPLALYEDPDHPCGTLDSRLNSLVLMLRLAHRLADLALYHAAQRPQLAQAWTTQAAKLDIPADEAGHFIDEVIAEWHDWGTLLQIHTEPLPSFCNTPHQDERGVKDPSALRIVVADSNEFTRRKTMAQLAEGGGHSVYPVSDGHSALALVPEVIPHVIIAHCNLQQLDSLALCRTLREADEGRSIYILLMDDHHNVNQSISAYESGADGYVSSAISSKALHTRLVAAQRMARLKNAREQDRAQLRKLATELELAKRRLADTEFTR